jgi:adenosine deaminase
VSLPPGGDQPKAEIHLHLEGSIDLDTLLALRARHGGDRGPEARRRLAALYRHRDFPDFLAHFRDVCAELRTPEDFALATTRLAARLVRDNVRHAEVMCSVGIFTRRGLPAAEILDAVGAAAAQAEADGGPRLRFLLDSVRQWGPAALEDLVEIAAVAAAGGRVIGVGMGGDESAVPAAAFADAYRAARRLGLRTTAHAGEFAGPRSVWEAIEVLEVDRIGHGIRALEDAALVSALARLRMPLECCPTSNLGTRVVASWEAHPMAALHRSGVLVTVNSDDPALFGTSLGQEWRVLGERMGLSRDEVLAIGRNTIAATFLDGGERATLLDDYDEAARRAGERS